MKRYIVILSCLSVLYAGAVWAYEGCRNLVGDGTPRHHVKKTTAPPPLDRSPGHHNHTDRDKIHCLSFFGEFFLRSRITENRADARVRCQAIGFVQLSDDFSGVLLQKRIHGPPVSNGATNIPRYLSLSVLRI